MFTPQTLFSFVHFWKCGTAQHRTLTIITFRKLCHTRLHPQPSCFSWVWDLEREREVADHEMAFWGSWNKGDRIAHLYILVLFWYSKGNWDIINEHGSSFRFELHSSCWCMAAEMYRNILSLSTLGRKTAPVRGERYSSGCHIHPASPSLVRITEDYNTEVYEEHAKETSS